MNGVTFDELRPYRDPVEIFDSMGKLLGVYFPAEAQHLGEVYQRVISQIDWAEIERRKQAKDQAKRGSRKFLAS